MKIHETSSPYYFKDLSSPKVAAEPSRASLLAFLLPSLTPCCLCQDAYTSLEETFMKLMAVW